MKFVFSFFLLVAMMGTGYTYDGENDPMFRMNGLTSSIDHLLADGSCSRAQDCRAVVLGMNSGQGLPNDCGHPSDLVRAVSLGALATHLPCN